MLVVTYIPAFRYIPLLALISFLLGCYELVAMDVNKLDNLTNGI